MVPSFGAAFFRARASAPATTPGWPARCAASPACGAAGRCGARRCKQAADMRRMIADAKRAADHLRHPLARPHLATEAIGLRSRSKRAGSCASCSGVSRGCRPGAGCRRSPSTPCSRARLSHWLTAPRSPPAQRRCPAVSSPASFSSQARRRRPSRQSSCVVFVLMPLA